MKLKVCGIGTADNLKEILTLGVDYLGFNFYPPSKRFIEVSKAKSLATTFPASYIGIFVDPPLSTILHHVKEVPLKGVQLHGDESKEFCQLLREEVGAGTIIIKALSVNKLELVSLYNDIVNFFLFDTPSLNHGGSGEVFSWELLEDYTGTKPFFLAGGISIENSKAASRWSSKEPYFYGYDINSRFEVCPGKKDPRLIKEFMESVKGEDFTVSANGYFGEFGGVYVPEMLHQNVHYLAENYLQIINEEGFQKEFRTLLRDYVGRPSPLYLGERFSAEIGKSVYFKREDLNHTGSHKINNTVGQGLLAKRLGKKRIIAETGAGQHGVATATVCALLNLECIVYMGAIDVERQQPNVRKMRLLGAKVVPVVSGSQTLKDATNEAMRDWIANPLDTHYIIGSVVGPHPFPDMVGLFQRVIGEEVRAQLKERTGRSAPDMVVACVGGGSNAVGIFHEFLDDPTELIGIEAGGLGINTDRSAATIALGRVGVLHGSKTFVMQSSDGQIQEAHSISAGLDYPGIGPLHAHLNVSGRARYVAVNDEEALEGALKFARLEGIIPALETAHALAWLLRPNVQASLKSDGIIVVNLSGDGEKDMATYLEAL